MKIPDHFAQVHGFSKGSILHGHNVVVEGLYFAFVDGEKVKREYCEEFKLEPAEAHVHGQGALGHLLMSEKLIKRLREKDKDFRGVQTHAIVSHENIVEAPAVDPVEVPKPAEPIEAPAVK